MQGTKKLRTLSTGTVHAAFEGRPACPSRTKKANPYSDTSDAVTCRHCLKLLAEIQLIEAETVGESADEFDGIRRGVVDTPRPWACDQCSKPFNAMRLPVARIGESEDGHLLACADCAPAAVADQEAAGARRLLAAAEFADTTEPTEHRDDVLLVAMSVGMSLGLEAVDECGYAGAEVVMWKMARRELSTADIAEMAAAFRRVFARRQAAKQCTAADCVVCKAVA